MTPSRTCAALLAVGVLVVTGCTSSPSSEAATRTRVSAKLSQAHPIARETFTTSGHVSSHFKRVVVLQQRHGSSWRTVARSRTSSSGAYHLSTHTTSSSRYSVLAPGVRHSGHRYSAGRSKQVVVRPVHQTALLDVLPQVVQQGTTPAASSSAKNAVVARFTPARPGRRVVFKAQQTDGTWKTVRTTSQHSDGSAYYFGSAADVARTFTATTLARYGAVAKATSATSSGLAPFDPTTQPSDEFSGSTLDTTKWDYREGAASSRTHSVNDSRAVDVSGGTVRLHVKPAQSDTGGKLLNAQIAYKQLMQPYGVAAARIKFESGRGQHGSFWLQSPTYGKYAGDPKKSGSEIDVVEFFGKGYSGGGLANFLYYTDASQKNVKIGDVWSRASSLIHHDDAWWKSYHVFSVKWTPTGYTFFVDGQVLFSTTRAVSGQPETLILSLLTSDWELPHLDHKQLPTTMYVDWMKVWQNAS